MKVKNLRLRIPECFMNAEFWDGVLGSGLINAFNHSPQDMTRCTGGHPVLLGRDSGRRLMVKHLDL